MKRILSFFIIVLLVLSGCAKNIPEPEPEPPAYSAAPAATDAKITVGGRDIPAYGGQTLMIKLDDLFSLGGKITATNSETAPYSCTFELGGRELALFDNLSITSGPFLAPVFDGKSWYVPADVALDIFGYHKFFDSEQNKTYFTKYPVSSEIPVGIDVPVLMYHAVSDDMWGIQSLFVSPSELEKQLKYLVDNGYTPIHFDDLADVQNIEKPILLTFDDGYEDNYTELFPLLEKYQVKATVFMIMSEVGNHLYLNEDEIKKMSDSGLVSVQSHTVTHPFLSDLDESSLERELYDSKLKLLRITGKEPFVLCYPTGKYSGLSLEKTAEHYQFGLVMSGPRYVTGENPYKIARYYIKRSTSVSDFAAMIS